jgi:hypothetical protein
MMPGDYASIHLQAASSSAAVLSVPSSALIFDARGLSVATVDDNNRVVLKPVTLERDLGSVVEIASGLGSSDRVIQNPPDGIGTGAVVNVVGNQSAVSTAAAGAGKNHHG